MERSISADAPGLQDPAPALPQHPAHDYSSGHGPGFLYTDDDDYAEFVAAPERQMPAVGEKLGVGSPFWNGTPSSTATPPAVTRGVGRLEIGRLAGKALMLGMLVALAVALAVAMVRGWLR